MIEQLQSFAQYPGAYGLPWLTITFGAVVVAGVVVAQMEKAAHRLGRRQDPGVRLNIALAGLTTLALIGAALAVFNSNGILAGSASVVFFLALCLAIPVGRLPGARVLAHQPARAWALIALLAAIGFIFQPSFPTAVILVLTFTRVRMTWGAVIRDEDEHAAGPIDRTSRRSALAILAFVVVAASIGMQATTVDQADLEPLSFENPTVLPGTERGPTIAPPTP